MYTKKIYFSGGDFHELEEVFRSVPGVVGVQTGYINAEGEATYEGISSGSVKGYMGVEVSFNPKKMDPSQLMDLLFTVVNPYVPDGQGKARGEMHRAGVFYKSAEDEPQIDLHMNFIAGRGKPPSHGACITMNDPNSDPKLTRKLCAVALPLTSFSPAEPEHQGFLQKNPNAETYIDFKLLRECQAQAVTA